MAEQKVEHTVYDPNSGRCKVCGEEILRGDTSHADGCGFAIMVNRLYVTIAKLEKITMTDTCCAYCGAAYPEGTPRFGGDALTEHIKVCPEHPMRQTEERVKQLEALFDAVDDLLYDPQTVGYPDDHVNTDHLASLRGVFLGLCTKAEATCGDSPG